MYSFEEISKYVPQGLGENDRNDHQVLGNKWNQDGENFSKD